MLATSFRGWSSYGVSTVKAVRIAECWHKWQRSRILSPLLQQSPLPQLYCSSNSTSAIEVVCPWQTPNKASTGSLPHARFPPRERQMKH